jgi:signal peptidase II
VRQLSIIRLKPSRTALIGAFAAILIDQSTKVWAREVLSRPKHVLGPVWLRLVYNEGVSFSMGRHWPLLAQIVAFVLLVGVAVGMARAAAGWSSVGFGLMLGGGAANALDRLTSLPHHVTDFIAIGSFPVFNMADACVTCGLGCILLTLRSNRPLWRE